MSGPPAATAAVRVAVRRSLTGVEGPVHAAVSGGADSLALAAALAFERPGSGAVVVDHGLQPGSDEVAAKAAAQCEGLGLTAQVLTPADGRTWGSGGPEARARALRYALLAEIPGTVLLGHTRDDQAETVLLGLVRGSGARALSGMAPVRGRYRRPLLDLTRETTRQACREAGLDPWDDPHNDDPGYTRVQVRRLLAELPLATGLVRSARLLREDADALDALTTPTDDVAVLAALPAALRSRSLKAWAEQQCGRGVTAAQVDALRGLVEDWRGQGPVALPGGGRVSRRGTRLAFDP
ncbi:MAG: tRNA lysidine(34) synthetase TilS [Mycobacteriales bacterium]